MTTQVVNTRIKLLNSTLAVIEAANPVLLSGERWLERHATTGAFTGRSKTGLDGVLQPDESITGTPFNSLPFDPAPGGSGPGGAGTTNLSIAGRNETRLFIASDTGEDAELLSATAEFAGLQSAADKAKVDASTSVALSAGLAIALG